MFFRSCSNQKFPMILHSLWNRIQNYIWFTWNLSQAYLLRLKTLGLSTATLCWNWAGEQTFTKHPHLGIPIMLLWMWWRPHFWWLSPVKGLMHYSVDILNLRTDGTNKGEWCSKEILSGASEVWPVTDWRGFHSLIVCKDTGWVRSCKVKA